MIIKIRGVTSHGKNRVKEHGEMWKILPCPCKPIVDKKYLESVDTGYRRWLDHNFEEVV